MIFKDPRFKAQFEGCPKALQNIATYLDARMLIECGRPLVITRVTDPVAGESGVHPDGRAFDGRIETGDGFYIPLGKAYALRDEINARWVRDDEFQCCLIHSFNGGMIHFHCQIPSEWFDYSKVKMQA